MDAVLWVKLASWHLVGKGGFTRCGRPFLTSSPSSVDLPFDEKSCENCLRLAKHDAEKRH